MDLKIKVCENGMLPSRGTRESAGIDLYATEDVTLDYKISLVDLGVQMAIPEGYFGLLRPRSGLASKGVVMASSGIVDSDYRGNIKIPLYYHYSTSEDKYSHTYKIRAGDRVAQMVIIPYEKVVFLPVDSLENTDRSGGFGSTGVA